MSEATFLDGNAAGGDLRDLFSIDMTAATCRCDFCGRIAALADTQLYADAPGLVLRCPECEHVLLRFARTGSRAQIELRGLSYISIESEG
jgi:phage FluMu protein Com